MSREQFRDPKWSYFVHFRCTVPGGPGSLSGPVQQALEGPDRPVIVASAACFSECQKVQQQNLRPSAYVGQPNYRVGQKYYTDALISVVSSIFVGIQRHF